MNVDGSNLRALLETGLQPAWSPNGEQLAYVQMRELRVLRLDGGGDRLVFQAQGTIQNPAWSPDGSKLALGLVLNRDIDVYVINADGTDLINVTNTTDVAEQSPSFSPDGGRIVFSAGDSVAGVRELRILDLADMSVRPVPNTVGAVNPSWF